MSEVSPPPSQHPHRGGLSPDFNLGDSLGAAREGDTEFTLPNAVEAADRLWTDIYTDPKTGLYNEKAFRENLERTIENLDEGDELICYFADLNGFKVVNDEYQHEGGDEVLGIVGEVINSTFQRDTDIKARGSRDNNSANNIARLGGDEFSVVTVTKANDERRRGSLRGEEAIIHMAEIANEKLQERLVTTKFKGAKVSLAIGGAIYQKGDTAKSLIVKADFEMFRVKYASKIQRITDEDRARLREIIPYIEDLGSRVDDWLKQEAFAEAA